MPFLHCPVALCHIAAVNSAAGSAQIQQIIIVWSFHSWICLIPQSPDQEQRVLLTEPSIRAGRKECFQLGSLGVRWESSRGPKEAASGSPGDGLSFRVRNHCNNLPLLWGWWCRTVLAVLVGSEVWGIFPLFSQQRRIPKTRFWEGWHCFSSETWAVLYIVHRIAPAVPSRVLLPWVLESIQV